MPGAGGKSNAGFTKSANKQKFVRNRDLKLTERELKAEEHIKQKMGDGICPKCREKLQWRFQYNKYKPLKSVANCRRCRDKCVTKAYRTYCDKCANELHVCPGCCVDMNVALQSKKERDAFLGVVEDDSSAKSMQEGGDDMEEGIPSGSKKRQAAGKAHRQARPASSRGYDDTTDSMNDDVDGEDDAEDMCGSNGEGWDDDSSRRRLDDETTADQPASTHFSASSVTSSAVDDPLPHASLAISSQWDAHKFENIAYSKYSKSRVVGSVEDSLFSFGYSSSSDAPLGTVQSPPAHTPTGDSPAEQE